MNPKLLPRLSALILCAAPAPAPAADLPFAVGAPPPWPSAAGPSLGGGGFRVARWPLRPPPLRYDVYGYPLLPGAPDPLAAGGCPAALQPDYDAAGNLAGYAPLPMCR